MRKGRNDSLVLDHSNDLIAMLCRDFKCVWAIVDHFSGGFIKELRHFMKFHFSLNQSCFFHMCIDHNCVVCLFATYISAMKSHSPNQSNQLVFALFEGKKSQIVCTQFIVRIALEKELFLIGNNWMGYSFARGFMCAFLCVHVTLLNALYSF